jgi:hypothetical protein
VHFPGKHIGQGEGPDSKRNWPQQVPHLGQKARRWIYVHFQLYFQYLITGNLPDKALVKLDGYHLGPGVSFDKSRLNSCFWRPDFGLNSDFKSEGLQLFP